MATIEEKASEIAQVVADYRIHDGVSIDADHVVQWVEQFDEGDRDLVVSETLSILKKRYMSLEDASEFIAKAMTKMAQDYGYEGVPAFLEDSCFLDLQEAGKSQKELLKLVGDTALNEYGYEVEDTNAHEVSNVIYVDDVLCTGNTLYYDVKEWLDLPYEDGTNLSAVLGAKTRVLFLFIFAHELNSEKVKWRFHFLDRRFRYALWHGHMIDNDHRSGDSNLEYLLPIRDGISDRAQEYFDALGVSETGVFRDPKRPNTESFFSSSANRIRIEKIFLEKGFDILESVNAQKENVRPLGYTLPSHKNFGFGTLCFTWRNVPNNTPLVFWYSAPEWTPLFEKKEPEDDFEIIYSE